MVKLARFHKNSKHTVVKLVEVYCSGYRQSVLNQRSIEIQTGKQTDRSADSGQTNTDRHALRQTDKQTDLVLERQTDG